MGRERGSERCGVFYPVALAVERGDCGTGGRRKVRGCGGA